MITAEELKTWGGRSIPLLLVLVVFVLIFKDFVLAQRILLTTDAAISGANISPAQVVTETYANWNSRVLLGMPRGGIATQMASLLKVYASGILWNNTSYALACVLASVGLATFFRKEGLGIAATCCAVLSAFWLGSNFTLIYAGHIFKPYVILFFVLSLIPASRAAAGRVRSSLVCGACIGLMFAQQPDVAMFFAPFAGAYLLFRLWRAQGFSPLNWLKMLIPAALVAILFAAGPLLSGYKHHVKHTAQVQTESSQEKWEYVTQWSWPPEETVAFIAPGYTGWRSGEPDGPYWGRMGQSPEWEQTQQRYENFKLENTYLGLIPVAFALFALFSFRHSPHRAEIIFWSSATVVALLLAFGKYFPLYSLFYKLPVVNNIRNPNKFLQVFQICLAILTAYGIDGLFSGKWKGESGTPAEQVTVQRFFWVTASALGGLGLWALSLSLNRGDEFHTFQAAGWPPEAVQAIVQNKITSLWHASFMAAMVSVVFAFFSFPVRCRNKITSLWHASYIAAMVAAVFTFFRFQRFGKVLRFRNWLAAGLVLIVAADAVKLSKHYVEEMPRSYIEANALTDFLTSNLGHERVALLTQESFYNIWLSYLLPYNHIPAFNFTQMPRMPVDYELFLMVSSKTPFRMWRFAGVKYLLGPAFYEQELPAGQLRKVFAYDVTLDPDNELRVVPSPGGAHAVFELINPIPRCALVKTMDPETDKQALSRIADSQRPLLGEQRVSGSVTVLKYRPGRIKLQVQADQACMLRIAERWDPDWKATVDGTPVNLQRIDFLCQGVSLPAGIHQLSLSYSPSRTFFYMQCVGYLVLLLAL